MYDDIVTFHSIDQFIVLVCKQRPELLRTVRQESFKYSYFRKSPQHFRFINQ